MGDLGARRVVLSDTRGQGRYLRVTWHPKTATVVFSHWVEDVCVGSTQVQLPDAARVIALVVDALQDAATGRVGDGMPPDAARRSARIIQRLLDRFRTASAQVVAMGDRQGSPARAASPTGSD